MTDRKNSPSVIEEGVAGVAAMAFTILLLPVIRPWCRKWGATDDEVQRSLPGDELAPHPGTEPASVSQHCLVISEWGFCTTQEPRSTVYEIGLEFITRRSHVIAARHEGLHLP